jgi:shikimate kinase
MGFSSWFYVEVKTFEFLVSEGGSILHLVERSRRVSRAILLGKLTVVWLSNSVEELVRRIKVIYIFKLLGDGNKEFIA